MIGILVLEALAIALSGAAIGYSIRTRALATQLAQQAAYDLDAAWAVLDATYPDADLESAHQPATSTTSAPRLERPSDVI